MAKVLLAGTSVLALGIVLGVFAWDWLDDRSKPTIVIEDPRPDAQIVVSVEGAVATPGIYRLKGDARVQNALDAAGGPASGADLARINPAARLRDEERVVVPWAGTGGPTAVPPGTSEAATPMVDARALININTASADLLETLPGVGPVLAKAIVTYREQNGPFRSVDELAEVKGISLKMVDEIRTLVTV